MHATKNWRSYLYKDDSNLLILSEFHAYSSTSPDEHPNAPLNRLKRLKKKRPHRFKHLYRKVVCVVLWPVRQPTNCSAVRCIKNRTGFVVWILWICYWWKRKNASTECIRPCFNCHHWYFCPKKWATLDTFFACWKEKKEEEQKKKWKATESISFWELSQKRNSWERNDQRLNSGPARTQKAQRPKFTCFPIFLFMRS